MEFLIDQYFFMNIPKFLSPVSSPKLLVSITSCLPTFSISYLNLQYQAKISVVAGQVIVRISEPYAINKATLITVNYNETGGITDVVLEMAQEKMTIKHEQQQRLPELVGEIARVLSYKGFNEYYKPLKRLGRGSFASVYLIEHKFTKKVFAAKVFPIHQCYSSKDGKQALQNQISIMRSLEHPNIIQIYGIHQTENLLYLIMQYLSGGTLENYLRSQPYLSGPAITCVLSQTLSALSYLSALNIMHRDLKPSNILQRENGVWVITDFGLAAKADEDYLWKTCGTPGFVAPEILRSDEKYGQACDMFSLGVIGYIMVLGQRPFPGKEQDEVYEKNRECEVNIDEKVPKEVAEILTGMLESLPKNRLTPKKALALPYFTTPNASERLTSYLEEKRTRSLSKVLKLSN